MIRSRRAAITASLIGALLIAGVPTLAFGEGDATREAKGYSATAASDEEIAAQKAKDDEKKEAEKKAADKKAADKKAADKKNDGKKNDGKKNEAKKADDNKKSDEAKKAEARKADEKKAADKKKSDDAKKDNKNDNDKASDRKRHDNDGKNDWKDGDKRKKREEASGRKRDHGKDGKRDVDDKDEWKRKKHNDKHGKDWDHNRDRDRHRRHYRWDTHRRYYKYGYYGAGWYDHCGYYGPNYRGDGDDYYYYGPDACGYEYGGYRSHFLVDMSWDQVIADPNAGGYPAEGAYGVANLDIDVQAGVVCFRLAYDGIDRAIGAQIHPGRLGEVGPSIVLLHVGSNGDDGCVRADPRILYEIQNDPRGYYLEVNDEEHGQAMRGQLDAPDYRNRY